MKRITSLLWILLGLIFPNIAEAGEAFQPAQPQMDTKIFSYAELPGGLQGVCFGRDYACVYASDGYLLLDENGEIVYQHQIDHPKIQEDASYINDAIYRDDTLWLLIFDFSAEKSYVLRQTKLEKPQYGALMTQTLHACTIVESGVFLAGADKNLKPWYGCMGADGALLWEKQPDTEKFIYQHCIAVDSTIYLVASPHRANALSITMCDTEGTILDSKIILLPDSLQSDHLSYPTVFDMDVLSDGILLVGQQLSQNDAQGFYVVLDENLELIDSKIYTEYERLFRIAQVQSDYMILTNTYDKQNHADRRFIISMDGSFVLPLDDYDSMYLPLGIAADFHDHLYVYGSIYHPESPATPSGFLSQIIDYHAANSL